MTDSTIDDVAAIRAIVRQIYDSISGPAGPRDWELNDRAFAPGGSMVVAHKQPGGSVMLQPLSVEEYRRTREPYFTANAFYEIETRANVRIEGNLAQVLSYYESRHDLNEPPFETGVNCISLAKLPEGWRVIFTMWEAGQIGSKLR
jgi:hypothetical protein